MAYTSATFNCMLSGVGDGASLWHYTTTDAHTDVDASGYFSNGAARGLKANDVVFVIDTDTGTMTHHYATSATTIAASTLS